MGNLGNEGNALAAFNEPRLRQAGRARQIIAPAKERMAGDLAPCLSTPVQKISFAEIRGKTSLSTKIPARLPGQFKSLHVAQVLPDCNAERSQKFNRTGGALSRPPANGWHPAGMQRVPAALVPGPLGSENPYYKRCVSLWAANIFDHESDASYEGEK